MSAQRQAEFQGRYAETGANPWEGREDDVGGKCAERSEPGEPEQDPPSYQTALERRGVRDRKRGHYGFLLTTRHVDVP